MTAPLVWKGVRIWLDRLNGGLLPFYIDRPDRGDRLGARRPRLPRLPARRRGRAGHDAALAAGFAAYMGVWILMMFTMDFARFAKPEDEGYHRAITFGWLTTC